LNYYDQVIQENPDHVAVYHKAIDIKPDDPQRYIKLADTLVNLNNLDGAILFYGVALDLEPDNPEVVKKLEGIVEKKKLG
jgi:Cytochrome c biogenesis factor